MKDPRVRTVAWRDLVAISRTDVIRELFLSAPWLIGSLACYHLAASHYLWILAGGFCAFYFYLTGLRQAHNAHHYAIGLSRRGHEWVMYCLSILMLSSMHAVQATHLHHHQTCLSENDIEAFPSRLPWWKALLLGPLFILKLHYHGYRLARKRRNRIWIVAELSSIALWVTLVFAVLNVPVLQVHVLVMIVGQIGTGLFAVWTVHHDCDPHYYIARTQRGWLKNAISYCMFLHLEHHLFPAVPTCHLPELARRLDAVVPELKPGNVY